MERSVRMKDETFSESALIALRTDIVRGGFKPDQPLKIHELKEQYGFGASPLREALSRLVGEGLVRLESNRGFRVVEFSRADLDDLAFMRTAIEVHAIRRAIEVGGEDWEAGIVAALHKLILITRKTNTDPQGLDTWQKAHDEFHVALVTACGSRRIMSQQKLLAQQQDRYRRELMGPNFPRDMLIAEHESLAQAALERDVSRIVPLLEGHFALTSSFYGDALQTFDNSASAPVRQRAAPLPPADPNKE